MNHFGSNLFNTCISVRLYCNHLRTAKVKERFEMPFEAIVE